MAPIEQKPQAARHRRVREGDWTCVVRNTISRDAGGLGPNLPRRLREKQRHVGEMGKRKEMAGGGGKEGEVMEAQEGTGQWGGDGLLAVPLPIEF